MLTLHRRELSTFRTILRRCRSTRTTETAQLVRIQEAKGSLRFLCTNSGVTLGYTLAHAKGTGNDDLDWCLPVSVLEVAEQAVSETVELQQDGKNSIKSSWPGGECEFDLETANLPAWPDSPNRWGQADTQLLVALHEACRTADRSGGRFSTHRIQIQGRAGRIVGTDTRHALAWDGFRFPFQDTVLVPAVAVFGSKEWKRETVRVGRNATQIVFGIGPWTLALEIDDVGRFPDLDAFVPKSQTPSLIHLAEDDARQAIAHLKLVPKDPDDQNAVTIEADGETVAARWRTGKDEPTTELRLSGSRCTGPAVRYVFERQYLLRGLALGLRTFQVCSAGRPLAMTDRHRLYLFAGFDPSTALPPEDDMLVANITAKPATPPIILRSPTTPPESTMPIAPTRHEPPPEDDSSLDPLTEAEAVRDLLAEAAQRTNQLLHLLKAKRKADRAITQAVRSLRALPLGRGN